MDSKKINLAKYIASLELEGVDKVKQDLKEIEESLDRILSKYEKVVEPNNQAHPLKCIINLQAKSCEELKKILGFGLKK